MRGRLNLATRRIGNERLPVLALGLACAALLGVTVRHAFVIRGLLPRNSSALSREVASLEAEVARLKRESAELRNGPKPEKARIEEWQLVKDLVDRRVFRWTELFSRLAHTLPKDVRLTSVTPTMSKGIVSLEVGVAAKSLDSGLAFIHVLEERPEFDDVFPSDVNENRQSGEKEFGYVMRYTPPAAPLAPAPQATPAAASSGAAQ